MIEAQRLSFVRNNQKNLRADMYKGLMEAVLRGETNPSSQGKRIILPSSYVGGARYMTCLLQHSNILFLKVVFYLKNFTP